MRINLIIFSIVIICSICSSADYEVNFIDTFLNEKYISEKTNLNISSGEVKLLPSAYTGVLKSSKLNAYAVTKWGNFYANALSFSNYDLKISILEDGKELSCPSYAETIANFTDYSYGNHINKQYANDSNWDTYAYCYGRTCETTFFEKYYPPNDSIGVYSANITIKFFSRFADTSIGYYRLYYITPSNEWVFLYGCNDCGEKTVTLEIPEEAYSSGVLYIVHHLKYGETKLYESKVTWFRYLNVTKAIEGYNLSNCFNLNTSSFYLIAEFNKTISSPILFDWNLTYYQSENPCVDYDGGIVSTVGSNVSKVYVSYFDKCENSVLTEFYCDKGIVKSVEINCRQGCADSMRCRESCTNNITSFYYHRLVNSSKVQYLLFNFSEMTNYVKQDVSNVISFKQAWRRGDYSLLANVTDSNVVIYLSDDLTNIIYPDTTITPNETLKMQMQNFSRIFPFYELSFAFEEDNSEFNNDLCKEHLLYVYCPTAGTSVVNIKERNVSKLRITTYEKPLLFSSIVYWDDIDVYTRSIIPFLDFANLTIYLLNLNLNHTIDAITFSLNDLTRTYNNAYMRFMKYVDGILTDMHSDWFGADKKLIAYLIDNHQYVIIVGNYGNINDSKQPGRITATRTDLYKTVTLVPQYDISQLTCPCNFINITYSVNYNTSQICLSYSDVRRKTEWANLFIYDSNRTLLYNYSSPTPSSFTSCYIVPDNNATYILSIHFSHPDCSQPLMEWSISLSLGVRKLVDLLIPETGFLGMKQEAVYMMTSLVLITSIAFVFGAFFSGMAAISIAAITSLVYVFGWINISAFILATLWVLAVLHFLSQRRYVT